LRGPSSSAGAKRDGLANESLTASVMGAAHWTLGKLMERLPVQFMPTTARKVHGSIGIRRKAKQAICRRFLKKTEVESLMPSLTHPILIESFETTPREVDSEDAASGGCKTRGSVGPS
jgi:hypothetical protein